MNYDVYLGCFFLRELEAEEKQTEDILRELQTLAQELNIKDSSPQEIIEAACRYHKLKWF